MQTHVLFEHPLNEKMRTAAYQFLLQQLTARLPLADHADALHFFRNAGELLDIFERGDTRTELLKELERQQRKLKARAEVPGVDQGRIDAIRQQLKETSTMLMAAPGLGSCCVKTVSSARSASV